MLIFQAFSIVFGLLMLYQVRIHARKKILDPLEAGMWLMTWLGFIYFSLFPQTLSGLTEQLRFGRTFDVLVVIGFVVLSVFTYLTRVALKKIEKKFIELVREKAVSKVSLKARTKTA